MSGRPWRGWRGRLAGIGSRIRIGFAGQAHQRVGQHGEAGLEGLRRPGIESAMIQARGEGGRTDLPST